MKRTLLILLIFCTLKSNSQNGWTQLNSGTNSTLYSIWFVNYNTGYCSGSSILKTTNSGISWFINYSGGAVNLQFINENTGFAIGGSGVIKTTNAGVNWISYTTPFYPESIYIVDSLIGYGCGSPYKIMKTFDGGLTWYSIDPGTNLWEFHSIAFTNVNNGVVVGGRDEKPNIYYVIRKTTNGGITWSNALSGAGNQLINLSNIISNTLYATDGYRNYKTIDGGSSWSLSSLIPTSNYIYSLFFPRADTGFVVGSGTGNSGKIFSTSNGGVNWNLSFTQTPGLFRSVYFLDVNTGYVCGINGTIIKTTNGGVTFIQHISNQIPDKFSLSQNYPNPFNPTTSIKFDIPKAGNVSLKIYDITGKEVYSINEFKSAGQYEFTFDASNYASGLYFYELESGTFIENKKMVLIK